jgi:hypothetical protein
LIVKSFFPTRDNSVRKHLILLAILHESFLDSLRNGETFVSELLPKLALLLSCEGQKSGFRKHIGDRINDVAITPKSEVMICFFRPDSHKTFPKSQ